ncbi:cysteine-rich receptor-like protein kinase 10 [Abrus precatorius]|uniref:non-specific serine/threonine protein kinase n=1 Tax=Abrus precatorius TaxID=3816 RepID=A0A8B8M1W7_ABRPR|nr:cysteine-rich receptor-like protein kinase 10 [Abrus precatorius]
MVKDRPSPVLLCIILLLSINRVSCADPIDTYCSSEFPTYTPNSSFHNNLKLVLELLSSNNASKTGFYNTSVGEGSNKVYAQALCRGDITNSTVCKECVEKASQDIMNECKSEDAIIWYELCQVRYSFQMFFSSMVYTGKYPKQNDQEKNVSDPVRFDELLMYLMKNISYDAAFNPAKNMFASGEIDFPGKKTIYGLVQCTRDISETDCNSCLNSALTELLACCSYREGGIILSRTCNVRFQLSEFFNTSSAYLLIYPTSRTILIGLCTACLRRMSYRKRDEEKSNRMLLQELASPKNVAITKEGDLISSDELLFMTLAPIKAATDDFSDTNKLGQGGFGAVYKGVLSDGNEVAVKRLSRKSWQGIEEFKNEIILIAKLQHRNLVRLLGCVLEGEEKLLIYEFMSNKSLDQFIFDPDKRSKLDWNTYHGIINGIAKGLLYLHEESRLKIIHRDLKPNNVLLDHEMVAKISDFGMARIFSENQNAANTKRVVGTYGYMAPEYAMEGLFSMKSDVFSFGVILLEIISGKRNSGFYMTELAPTLLAYAWRLWNEGKGLDFVDPVLLESCHSFEVLRCMQIGLLCVQEDPRQRPTMSNVVVLLGSESMALSQPRQPAFSMGKVLHVDPSTPTNPFVNEIIFSDILPR